MARKMGANIRLGASAVVRLLREAYRVPGNAKAKEHAALWAASEILLGLEDAKVLAIAAGRATLRGFSDTGITYHDVPCDLCHGRGGIGVADCPTCGGDGFSPPRQAELKFQ